MKPSETAIGPPNFNWISAGFTGAPEFVYTLIVVKSLPSVSEIKRFPKLTLGTAHDMRMVPTTTTGTEGRGRRCRLRANPSSAAVVRPNHRVDKVSGTVAESSTATPLI